jgi:hypothetical protein
MSLTGFDSTAFDSTAFDSTADTLAHMRLVQRLLKLTVAIKHDSRARRPRRATPCLSLRPATECCADRFGCWEPAARRRMGAG